MKSSETQLSLSITGIGPIPSFKNNKSIFKKQDGTPFIATNPDLKKRMERLENAIVFALYSSSPTGGGATDGEWLKQLRTLLSGLSDDSLKEMPHGEYDYEIVPKGEEGVRIEIELVEP